MKFARSRPAGAVVVFAIVGAVLAFAPAAAQARKKKGAAGAQVIRTCVDDYKTGLSLETSGQLIEGRERFVRCSKAACGSPLREECTTRFTQLDTEIPSVVPIATDDEGSPRFDVEVKMDGQLLTAKLDGHAFTLNPGRHEMSFSADGAVFATQELLIVQGQRNRTVQARLGDGPEKRVTKAKKTGAVAEAPAALPAARKVKELPPPEQAAKQIVEKEEAEKGAAGPEVTLATSSAEEGSSVLPYVVGAAGLASIGTGVAFIYWGRKDNSRLSECATPESNCPQQAVDHIHRMYLIGNVALGVGVAALGAAYWLHMRSGSTAETRAEQAYRFDLAPTNSGAVASVSGSF